MEKNQQHFTMLWHSSYLRNSKRFYPAVLHRCHKTLEMLKSLSGRLERKLEVVTMIKIKHASFT